MNPWRALRLSGWAGSILAAAAGVYASRPAARAPNIHQVPAKRERSSGAHDHANELRVALDEVGSSTLFVESSPVPPEGAQVGAPTLPAPQPPLLLSGVILGKPSVAVISGFPGVEGSRALYEGESLSGIVLREVRSNYVVVRSADSSWRIRLARDGDVR